MEQRTWGYARVSTTEQHLDRQKIALLEQGVEERNIITDQSSGSHLEREGYKALKNTLLRRGDTLVISSLDRLSRNKQDIRNELQFFRENDIRLKVIDLPTTMLDMPAGQEWITELINTILMELLGTMAQQERETLRKRQAEGIHAARCRGVPLGRPSVKKPPNWEEVMALLQQGSITATKAMELTGTKRTTFYKLRKETKDTRYDH